MKTVMRGLIYATVAGVVAGVIASPFGASAEDPAPPTLTVPPAAAFLVGGQIGPSDIEGNPEAVFDRTPFTWSIPMRLTWSSTGSTYYDIAPTHSWGCTDPYMYTSLDGDTENLRYTVMMSDFDSAGWPCAAYSSETDGYSVIATHGDGSVIGKRAVKNPPNLYQEDGRTPIESFAAPLTTSYSGAWSVGFCDCASGGTQRASSQPGAAATVSRTFARGEHLALVMAEGPGRGKAAIYLDGVLTKTIDTYAATNINRIIQWDTKLSAGSHTIRVVNQATAGRPRIDLDAILTTS